MWGYKKGETLKRNKEERKGTVKYGRYIYERMKTRKGGNKETGRENGR